MDRVSSEREDDRLTTSRPPEPAPEAARPGSLQWASAMGNQAVAALARQAMEPEEEDDAETEEAAPSEVEQLESQGIGEDALAGLAAVDDLGEDELPE
jgi:hypothetical protein